jgi:hypothetical protein
MSGARLAIELEDEQAFERLHMKRITRDEILPLGEYERIRPHFRARVVDAKKARRVRVADNLSAVFENRDSALLQIQEMLRTERITAEHAIAHEIDTYNELVPGDGELSLTVFVEIAEKDERERVLTELAGLEQRVLLELDGERYQAKTSSRAVEGFARTTAVHYFKIPLPESAIAAIRAGTAKAAIVVDHPALSARAELSPATVRSLADDFA